MLKLPRSGEHVKLQSNNLASFRSVNFMFLQQKTPARRKWWFMLGAIALLLGVAAVYSVCREYWLFRRELLVPREARLVKRSSNGTTRWSHYRLTEKEFNEWKGVPVAAGYEPWSEVGDGYFYSFDHFNLVGDAEFPIYVSTKGREQGGSIYMLFYKPSREGLDAVYWSN